MATRRSNSSLSRRALVFAALQKIEKPNQSDVQEQNHSKQIQSSFKSRLLFITASLKPTSFFAHKMSDNHANVIDSLMSPVRQELLGRGFNPGSLRSSTVFCISVIFCGINCVKQVQPSRVCARRSQIPGVLVDARSRVCDGLQRLRAPDEDELALRDLDIFQFGEEPLQTPADFISDGDIPRSRNKVVRISRGESSENNAELT